MKKPRSKTCRKCRRIKEDKRKYLCNRCEEEEMGRFLTIIKG